LKNLLILDWETTGPDASQHKRLELGLILYSIEHNAVLQSLSTLLPIGDDPNIAQPINGIAPAAANEITIDLAKGIFQQARAMAAASAYVVAHNAEFDKQWCDHPSLAFLLDLPWLCSCHDFSWPRQHRHGQKLIELALAHGIGVCSAHRALDDCNLLARLFDVMGDRLPTMVEAAAMPRHLYIADVSFADKELARAEGFQWKGDVKQWQRKLTEAEAAQMPFPVSCPGLLLAGARALATFTDGEVVNVEA
jgi:DNA polymerase-3 subunit epsilon